MTRAIASLDPVKQTMTFHFSSHTAPPKKSSHLRVRAAWAVDTFRALVNGDKLAQKDVKLALVWLEEMLAAIHPFEAPRRGPTRARPWFAVKQAGPTSKSADVYFKNPGAKKRWVTDSKAEATELAEREGGYVVEVRK